MLLEAGLASSRQSTQTLVWPGRVGSYSGWAWHEAARCPLLFRRSTPSQVVQQQPELATKYLLHMGCHHLPSVTGNGGRMPSFEGSWNKPDCMIGIVTFLHFMWGCVCCSCQPREAKASHRLNSILAGFQVVARALFFFFFLYGCWLFMVVHCCLCFLPASQEQLSCESLHVSAWELGEPWKHHFNFSDLIIIFQAKDVFLGGKKTYVTLDLWHWLKELANLGFSSPVASL